MPRTRPPHRNAPHPRRGALAACLALACAVAALVPAGAAADRAGRAPYVPGELVVGLAGGGERVIEVGSEPLGSAIARLERREDVAYADRNWVASAAQVPLDGGGAGTPGGWAEEQWSLLGAPGGVSAEKAWKRVARAGALGGAGSVVAVVDTGVAYSLSLDGRFVTSPDFSPTQFVPGVDLVADDGAPNDENGHGTHVAGTIAEQATLEAPSQQPDWLTGIAYGATVMPVRVLDANGDGSSDDVSEGIVWAAQNGADVINLSLQFPAKVRRCEQVRAVCDATREARRLGALVVGAAGNTSGGGKGRALFPAAAPGVLAVSASGEHGCLSAYSHYGRKADIVAPGGGWPRAEARTAACAGDSQPIRQLSFECFPTGCTRFDRFAIRPNEGTSMAAAHASAVAALVRASGIIGADPKPRRLARRLTCTARPASPQRLYGAGLLDAARATGPKLSCARN